MTNFTMGFVLASLTTHALLQEAEAGNLVSAGIFAVGLILLLLCSVWELTR